MSKAEVYSVVSKCFTPVEPRFWEELTSSSNWERFLECCRLALSDKTAGSSQRPVGDRPEKCLLQEFLSTGEVNALHCPPDYDEKEGFAARHLSGHSTDSACPIESLYTSWCCRSRSDMLFEDNTNEHENDAASYMQAIIECLGMGVPEEYRDCPDHLSLELDLLAVLERRGRGDEAEMFIHERFQWLIEYRSRLLQVTGDASFYVGLIDILIGLFSDQIPLDDDAWTW